MVSSCKNFFFQIYQAADGCAQHCPSPACSLQKDTINWEKGNKKIQSTGPTQHIYWTLDSPCTKSAFSSNTFLRTGQTAPNLIFRWLDYLSREYESAGMKGTNHPRIRRLHKICFSFFWLFYAGKPGQDMLLLKCVGQQSMKVIPLRPLQSLFINTHFRQQRLASEKVTKLPTVGGKLWSLSQHWWAELWSTEAAKWGISSPQKACFINKLFVGLLDICTTTTVLCTGLNEQRHQRCM